VINSIKKLFK